MQEIVEKDRIAEKRRANRIEIVRMEATGNETVLERLSETYRMLELNSTAHTLDQWCSECSCIHTSEVVKEDTEWGM